MTQKSTIEFRAGEELEESVCGVLCDRRMKVKINGKVYNDVAGTWAVKKAHEKMEVAEMKTLRWMCGVTRLDKI